jgi:hypothetical protein
LELKETIFLFEWMKFVSLRSIRIFEMIGIFLSNPPMKFFVCLIKQSISAFSFLYVPHDLTNIQPIYRLKFYKKYFIFIYIHLSM